MGLTGLAAEARDKEGKFKKLNWKSALGFGIFITFFLGILIFGNHRFIQLWGENPGFWWLVLNCYGIFMFIHLFDLFILDYLIVVKWHPSFLKMPDTEYYTTFKPHVEGFFRGLPLGLVFSLIASLITHILS